MARTSVLLRIEAATMDEVRRWASDEFRSVNGQLEYLIHEALRTAGRLPSRHNRTDAEDKRDDESATE